MKILLVSHTFLPKYVGGTEVYTCELARELVAQGNEVEILCTDPLSRKKPYSVTIKKYRGLNINVIEKNILEYKDFSQTYFDSEVDKIFTSFIDEFQPDIIHYTHLMHLSVNIVAIAAKRNIKQIATLNDFWMQTHLYNRVTTSGELYENYSQKQDCIELSKQLNSGSKIETPMDLHQFIRSKDKTSYLKAICSKLLSRFSEPITFYLNQNQYQEMIDKRIIKIREMLFKLDLIIFPTVFLYQEFSRWGFQAKQVVISEHGIDTSLFKNFKKSASKKIRFAFIGAIVPAKGLDVLLNAWRRIDPKDAELKIYGNFGLDKKYSRSLKPLLSNLKNVELKGTFSPENIAQVFSEIDVLVLPSKWFENGPLVLRNSLLGKIPAIVTNLGSNPEYINHRVNGLLFINGDENDLASKLEFMINNPDQIKIMAKKIDKQKSIKQDASNLLNNYQNLLKS